MSSRNGSTDVLWVCNMASHYVRALHRELAESVVESVRFLYCTEVQGGADRSYEVGDLPRTATLRHFARSWEILGTLRQFAPRLIIVSGHHSREVALAALWGWATRRKVLYWSDTNINDVLRDKPRVQRFRRLVMRTLFSRLDALLYTGTCNRRFYEWALEGVSVVPRMYWLPYPALEPAVLRSQPSGSVLNLLYLGRLIPTKGVDNLVQSLGRLDSSVLSQVRLTIAGAGPMLGDLRQLADKLGLRGNVEFAGAVPSDRVSEFYSSANLVVLPSHREPWGLVVNEALAHGVPVMAPWWVGAAQDLLIDGQTGVVLTDNEPDTIAAAINKVVDNRQLLQSMGVQGRRHVIEGGWFLRGALEAAKRAIQAELR